MKEVKKNSTKLYCLPTVTKHSDSRRHSKKQNWHEKI